MLPYAFEGIQNSEKFNFCVYNSLFSVLTFEHLFTHTLKHSYDFFSSQSWLLSY